MQSEFTRQARQMASAPAFHVQAVLERFQKAVGHAPRERLLDVACGPGIVAEALAGQVGQVVGIDATPEMIRLARERFEKAGLGNGRFQVSAAEQLPFGAGAFGQVVTRLSFHHLQDVPAVLKEMRRVLGPGGQLAAADIVSTSDPERAALHNAVEQLRDPSHVHFFSHEELLHLIEAAGFSVAGQETWEQQRAFNEWSAIIADPARTQPLEQVMRALAQAGQDCGVSLREQGGELRFTHTWCMIVASRN
jgi:ubiquinone/menaquinone biosynthesis C-methylase UbiE